MSRGIYYQVLCENGHLHEVEIEELDSDYNWPKDEKFPSDWTCRYCRARYAWYNLVDPNERQKVKLEVETPAVYSTCECGHKHQCRAERYKIPKK